jgi:hypothetical protein
MSKTDQQLWGFLFTIMILHWTVKYRVTPVMVRFHKHPVSHRHNHCPLQAQQMTVMCHLRNQHQRKHLKMEMKGEAMPVMNITPTLPALLLCSTLDENCFQSYEEKVPFMKYRF